MKKGILKVLIFLLTALLLFYTLMPALNIHDARFYFFVLILLLELLLFSIPSSLAGIKTDGFKHFLKESTASRLFVTIVGLIGISFLYVILTGFIFSPLFMAKTYASRISVENVEFSEVPSYNFNTTAIIDRVSAQKLGDKVMGEMSDLVSQYQVSSEYSQISYQEGTYRVTPLAYDGFSKDLKKTKNGIPGYIIVNTTTGETKLVRLNKPMKYVPSAYFFKNLYRKLRMNHPFAIFGDPTFEIDEEGNPYYVCTTYTYRGISTLKRVTGVILFDPTDGSSRSYSIDEAPSWCDRIYPEELIEEELNDYGRYQNGFFNSFIGQQGVIQTSEGYNYISKDGDVWLYTGMTSAVADESNIGFMLVNLRNHKAEYIATSGADEYSVMDSAEGEVLNYGYTATFPVLVNIDDKPIYILSLKDSAGLVKMYAMVDAQDYQQVYTAKADKDAKSVIEQLILETTGSSKVSGESIEKTIAISGLTSMVIEGNTYYYLQADQLYVIKADTHNAAKLAFLKVGDVIDIIYYTEGDQNHISSIK